MKRIVKRIARPSNSVLGPRIARTMGENADWQTTVDFRGCKVWAGPRNKIEKAILWTGERYDLLNFAVVEQLVHPGSTCLDIGANIGMYSMVFAQLSGDSALVHSFEPVNHIRAKLIANARLNGFHRLNLNPFGLGEKDEVIEMYQVKPGVFRGGTSSFVHNESVDTMGQDKFEKKPVEVKTLDGYVAEKGLTAIDFIKIDVEGFEWFVLAGGRQSIGQLRPVILVEFDLVRHEPHRDLMRDFFQSLSYEVFELQMVHDSVCFIPYDFSQNPKFRNLVCRPIA